MYVCSECKDEMAWAALWLAFAAYNEAGKEAGADTAKAEAAREKADKYVKYAHPYLTLDIPRKFSLADKTALNQVQCLTQTLALLHTGARASMYCLYYFVQFFSFAPVKLLLRLCRMFVFKLYFFY